ncbi:tRNA pseudouridine(55) synthase TruB [Patescibacteria group bacterium]|nr:tRNA pseudouridine(55) synthase TruB [Patescibacteria group bacterium]
MNGIFAVYKPKGPTSNDVLNIIRKNTGIKKVGHAGTLDPLACGVLVVGVGREATKTLSEAVKKEKEYEAVIRLGITSTTDDGEGEKQEIKCKKPSTAQVREAVKPFVGNILQVPPPFSAIKVKGREAYKLARRGQKVELKPRPVQIHDLKILKYEWPYLSLRLVTGPGVYVRSLARDIGQSLGTGAYLYELERTRVGDFTKEKAVSPHDFKK